MIQHTNSPVYEAFLQQFSNETFPISLTGLAGSSLPFYIAKNIHDFQQQHIFVLPNREAAAFFYHDLEVLLNDQEALLSEKLVHIFPTTYNRTYHFKEIDGTQLKLRTEILDKLLQRINPLYIVTFPDALMQRLSSPKFLQENSFEIKEGEELPIEFFLEFLYENEYQQEEFVYEPGQFAWRGGIFDIFSYAEDQPFRIELDDETVTSIRKFDPESQLSIASLTHFVVMPNATKVLESETTSFFHYLDEKATLWLIQPENIYAKWKENEEKLQVTFEDKSWIAQHFYTQEETLALLSKTRRIWINATTPHDNNTNFNIQPQHHFNKNFSFLLEEWVDNYEKGHTTYFLSENQNQHERIQHILSDLLSQYNEKQHTNYTVEQLFIPSLQLLHEGFRDESAKLMVYTDHQFLEKYHRFMVKDRYKKSESFTLKELQNLEIGDFIVHADFGVGVYHGLAKTTVGGREQESIKLVYKDNDQLFISVHSLHKISKYVGKEGTPPTLHRLGSGVWERSKEKVKRQVKALVIDLAKLYAERKSKKGFAFSADNYLTAELEASFMYEDTPDQVKTMVDVRGDMEADTPMDRLVCGDVGFGKTEIAIRSAFKAVCDNKQVAVLVPTTVLALQHHKTFSERLKAFPCKVDYLNRFKTAKEVKNTLFELKEGKIDILIGTHKLLSKEVKFKDLGLLIIDEEQKFGVAAKEKLREYKTTVDTLTMSATPIPRTLQFSLLNVRDISVIATPPPNRHPIQTEIHTFNEGVIQEAISYELSRGGQAFLVHNKVQNIQEVARLVRNLVPEARVGVGHGQMTGEELEKVMLDFLNGDYDVLVATTIIESGLDITNANTMIINDAQNYALNVLHQLRGRVGRNNKKAFCYFLVPSLEILNDNAKKRLKAIQDFSDIGSGFQIAMRDLDIRGAGDILGAEQSGFINEMGFEMYQKIINEALAELQHSDSTIELAKNEGLIKRDCVISSDLDIQIPVEYVQSSTERMNLYKQLNNITKDVDLEKFKEKLIDMFGPLPKAMEELLQIVVLKRMAIVLHIEKIMLQKGNFVGNFIGKTNDDYFQSEAFSKVLQLLQKFHPRVELRELNDKPQLVIKDVKSIQKAIEWLQKLA